MKLEIASLNEKRREPLRAHLAEAAKTIEGPGHVTRTDDQFTWIIVEQPAKP